MKFSQLPRPFICAVIAEPTISECINQIDQLAPHVDAFEINIPQLIEGRLEDVFSATQRPCIATNRRADFMRLYGYRNLPRLSEEMRLERLRDALHSGAAMVDYELDAFDDASLSAKPAFGSRLEREYASRRNSRPTEFSIKPKVVRRQKQFAKAIRSVGGEVLISSHTQTRIRKGITLQIAKAMQLRGADLGKIVVHTFNLDDLLDLFGTAIELRKSLRIPFNLMNVGEQPILGRLFSVFFGSGWIYCRANSNYAFTGQPTFSDAEAFLRKLSVQP